MPVVAQNLVGRTRIGGGKSIDAAQDFFQGLAQMLGLLGGASLLGSSVIGTPQSIVLFPSCGIDAAS